MEGLEEEIKRILDNDGLQALEKLKSLAREKRCFITITGLKKSFFSILKKVLVEIQITPQGSILIEGYGNSIFVPWWKNLELPSLQEVENFSQKNPLEIKIKIQKEK